MKQARPQTADWLVSLAADLNRADSIDTAADRAIQTVETVYDAPLAVIWDCKSETRSSTPLAAAAPAEERLADPSLTVPEPIATHGTVSEAIGERGETATTTDPRDPLGSELLVSIDSHHVLSLGSTECDAFGETDRAVGRHIAKVLGSALDRLDGTAQSEPESAGTADDASALQRLHELMVAPGDFEDTIDRLLSLGCEHFDLDTGILAHVEGSDYEIEAVVDATGTHEAGAVYEFEETMCAATFASDATDPVAFSDSMETDYSTHPATDNVRAYIGVPVVVDEETYGTVNFSSGEPRETAFREGEIEFIKLLAQWVGSEIGRQKRVAELERYETILEAVGDPVYALDTEARFTFVNDAAKREFGYGEEILGEHVSIGMKEEDIQRVAEQRKELVETDKRSMTAQFELETADGSTRLVENRLALIGETSHRGSAGVIRDVTEREQRRQKLESFQQAIENAADGVAILDDDEYVYVDQTHVDMYGFESADQLLGNSWRMLYDDDEVERLETEVFPTLETDGHWRGKVTGSRPDGTTFPAELSLTIIEDGRLVCTVRDESERMERKRELELKERAMDEADVSIQITDPTQDGNPLVYVNEGFERETGYDKAEALGRNPRFLQGPETDTAKVDKLRDAVENEQPVTVELKNHRADGSVYWAKLSITPVYDDYGSVTNFIGIQQDVTERRQLVERLEKRTERLDLVLAKTGTGIVEWDLQTDELTWDETMVEVLGRDPETVDEFFELVHPDDRADIEADLERLLETGEPFRGECRIQNGDGEVTWLETQNVLIAEDGDSARVVAMGADITERKKREEAIIESEQRYQTLLRAAPDPVIIADAETGEIVEANAAAAVLRGESQEEIVGRHQSELHPSADAEAYRAAFENAIGGRTMVSELPDGSQVELCTADGEAVPVEINADTVELPQGSMIYGVFRDISDRVEKEQELELKERAMDEANLGITISDPSKPDNPLIYVNDGFLDQTGYSRTEAIGRNCRFLQGDDRDQTALDTLRDAIGDEEPVTVELRNYRKDGEQFWNRLSVTPIYDDAGELVNYIGIQQDVTEEKTKARQLRTLHDTTRELLQAEDLEAAAAVAVETMADELGVDVSGLYQRKGDELVKVLTLGPAADSIPDRLERGRTPMWEAMETGETVVYEDLTTIGDGIDRGNATAGIYIPLGDHGVLAAGVSDATALDSPARQLIEVLAGNLVAVLDTIQRARELTQERERFQLLTESVDEYAFLTVDDNGDIATWNEGAKTLFGYDAETAIGMSVTELHTPADRESGTTDRLLQQARIAGESADEGWRVRADGSEFFADVRYAKLETDDGEFRGYAKIVRDMTERRRQRRRTELFVEESDDVVAILDTDGSMTYVSGSAERVLGYDPDGLVGENLFDYIHADGREAAMEEFYDGIEDESSSAQIECRFRSGDGEWLNVDSRWRNMRDTDAIDGMLLYLRDVTEIKERARQFESIFNQTYQFTGLLEADGTVIEANEAALEFGGFSREDIIGRPFYEAPWWTYSEDVEARVRDALERAAEGEFVRYETEVQGASGMAVIDFSVKPVANDDGEITLLVVEGRDITEGTRRREHLQVMQRVLRHNMRNDLTKMRGFTEALYQEADEETRTQHFETIEAILDKWADMTEKMRQIRQVLESYQNNQTGVPAGELVDDAVATIEERDTATTVVSEISGGSAIQIPGVITEALRELLENGIEATTGSDARVEARLAQSGDAWVEITVVDNGPGMPDAEASVLDTGEETPLNHGQGLGLWMVRMLTKQVGGNVSVDVSQDGTAVTLQLPRSDQLSIPA